MARRTHKIDIEPTGQKIFEASCRDCEFRYEGIISHVKMMAADHRFTTKK